VRRSGAIFDYDATTGGWTFSSPTAPNSPNSRRRILRTTTACCTRSADGTFEDVTAKGGLLGENLDFNFGVAVGDYDNDGYPDLFVCAAGRNTLYHNNGNGTFTDVTGFRHRRQAPRIP
jgi:enediyne biosynthesis protein E4